MQTGRIKSILIFSLLIIFSQTNLLAQIISSAELKMKTVLNTGSGSIPEDLQTSKSIVVISMYENESDLRGDWKSLAEEAHFYIKRLGIDAVLYFYIDDLLAGYDLQRSISQQMVDRDIKNIFMLSKDKVNGRDQYLGVLTQFNNEPNFISNNQPAWKSQTSDLEILFRNLARAIDNADLKNENLLIIDKPEYYKGIDIIRGRRYENFNTDLRIDRLAVPRFVDLPVPENQTAQSSSEMVSLIKSENNKNQQNNAQLESIMSNYPYKFEIIPYEYDEKKLSSKGFQFVLMRINSSGKNVRKLLGYKNSDDINELITTKRNNSGEVIVKSIPIDGMVYKYYVKHINSGDIYLGVQWDGDDNWQEAMNNHISTIINKLKQKK